MKALSLGIAVPLAVRMSSMAVAGPGPAPVRLFIYYIPHGHPVEFLEPFGSGAGFLEDSRILAPLAPYGSYVNVVRGMSMNGVTSHDGIRAALTGAADGGAGSSIDLTIAQALGVDAHVLGAIPYDGSQGFWGDSFFVKHGSWVRPTESPIDAAAELLGNVSANSSEPDESVFRNEALSLTERQLERMHGALSGLTKEQNKLAIHIDAIRALKASGDRPTMNGCHAQPALPAVEALRGLDVLASENFGRVLDAHLEVAANALLCGTSRVVTLQNLWANSGLPMNFAGGPGIDKSHHDPLSHSSTTAGRAEFAMAQRWFYDRLVEKLIRVLDQPDPLDPANTALHNTLIYVCSEVSDGFNHNADASDVWVEGKAHWSYLPAVLIGRAGGYLGQNEVVTVNRLNTDMLATLAQAMGVTVPSIGGQSVNPIQELRA